MRNIFCVAASRGKERIIFVKGKEESLSEETLSTEQGTSNSFENVDISGMFDFKYKEDIEECFSLLQVTPLSRPEELSEIHISNQDELIDLSPCIGIYQEAVFFSGYEIDRSIELWIDLNKQNYLYTGKERMLPLDNKILILVSMETRQNRYREQVGTPFVSETERRQIVERLGSIFSVDETVQAPCVIDFAREENGDVLFSAQGFADVVQDDIVYELKFVSEVTHEHFLQCASYVVALGLEEGILWNTRNNVRYKIEIPDRKKYLDAVAKTVTKGELKKYCCPSNESQWKMIQSFYKK